MGNNHYIAPELELIELVVEQGFAGSDFTGTTPDYETY